MMANFHTERNAHFAQKILVKTQGKEWRKFNLQNKRCALKRKKYFQDQSKGPSPQPKSDEEDSLSTTSDFEYFKKLQKKMCLKKSKPKKNSSLPCESIYNVSTNRNVTVTVSKNRAILSHGQKKLKKRHEKSVVILVLIIAVFVLCHSFRLGVQTYQVRTSIK